MSNLPFLLASFLFVMTDAFVPRCGNCWCIPDDATATSNGTCPSIEPGILQLPNVSSNWPILMQSMQLTSAEIQLVGANNAPCFPFANSVGPLSYPESKYPQCVQTEVINTPGASNVSNPNDLVCAYKYVPNVTCSGRSYQVKTYLSEKNASADGAYLVHSGPCGVCSNAHDFAVRLMPINFQSLSIECGFLFATGGNFSTLVSCFQTKLGLGTQCATLWAHFTATNSAKCASFCIPDSSGNVVLNEGPPTCPLGPCLNCSVSFAQDFNYYGGVWKSPSNAGINDMIADPCSQFTRVTTHDPCLGALPSGPTVSPAPVAISTPAPTGGSTSGGNALHQRIVLMLTAISSVACLAEMMA
jgi:hypothetical protein